MLAGFLLLWAAVAQAVSSAFVPGPVVVLQAFVDVLIHGDVSRVYLHQHAGVSILRVLAGFAVASALAIPLGIALGLRPGLYRVIKVILEPVRFIPPIAWVPLAILLLRGYNRYLFIIALGTFFPILVATISGVARTDVTHIEVAKTLGFKAFDQIRRIVLPSAMPEILAGMRIGLGAGWMSIVAAEMIGGELEGIGRMMLNHAEILRVDVIIVGMLTVGLIGLSMNEVFLLVERHIFRWRRGVTV